MTLQTTFKRWRVFVAAGFIGLLCVLAYQHFAGGSEAAAFQTAKVTRGDLEVTISSAGKIAPKEEVIVGAQVSGQLEKLYVEAGDKVEAGDLLAQIDATIATTGVEGNRAQLKELRATLMQQQASLDLAKADADRADMLLKADAIARADFEAAKAAYQIAQGKLQAIEAQIERQSSTLQPISPHWSLRKSMLRFRGRSYLWKPLRARPSTQTR